MSSGVDFNLAVLYCYLIWTPVLFLFSWGLEVVIDTPSKNLAHALDMFTRYEGKPDRKFSDFLSNNWVIWVFAGLMIIVPIVTEIYGAVNDNGSRIRGAYARKKADQALLKK